MNLKISVLMPVWNRAGLIQGALQSIMDQTFQNWEMICIDDGSYDNTWNILLEAEKLDSRIKPFRFKKHLGLYHALTVGNEMCSGNIIVKQDSDDLSLPDRLEKIYWRMTLNNYEFFYHGMYQSWTEDNILRRIYIPASPIKKRRILKEQYIPGAFAYTKKFIREVPYRKTYCSDDWMLILDAFLKEREIGYLNEGLYELMLQEDSNSMVHENTGHYESDESSMKQILKDEYGIKNFKYTARY